MPLWRNRQRKGFVNLRLSVQIRSGAPIITVLYNRQRKVDKTQVFSQLNGMLRCRTAQPSLWYLF